MVLLDTLEICFKICCCIMHQMWSSDGSFGYTRDMLQNLLVHYASNVNNDGSFGYTRYASRLVAALYIKCHSTVP